MMTARPLTALLAAFAAWPLAAGVPPRVDPGLPDFRPTEGLHGALRIADSALTRAWAKAFARRCPDVAMGIGPPLNSSEEAVSALAAGKVDLAWLGPDLEPQELDLAREAWGRAPLDVTVATGSAAARGNKPAIAIYVNAANPLDRLSLRELDGIFSKSRRSGYPGPVDRWGRLGLKGEWANRPVHRYGMAINNRSGVPHGWVYFLMQRMLFGGAFKPDIVQVPDTAYGPGANRAFVEIVRDVARDPCGIAYSPFIYRTAGVKTLALAQRDGGPYYPGTVSEVAARLYPLAQSRALAARGGPPSPCVREFLLFALSRQGQAIVAADPGKSLPLPAGFAEVERAKLSGR